MWGSLRLAPIISLIDNPPSKGSWKRCAKRILDAHAYLRLLEQAEVKHDLEQLTMCDLNPHAPSALWKVTHCTEHFLLTSRSNFRIRLLLGCHGLESDASRFSIRRNGLTRSDPSCKLCNAELEVATHFISVCPALEAKRRELLSHAPLQLEPQDPARDPIPLARKSWKNDTSKNVA